MNTASLSCLVAFGSLLLLGACSSDNTTPGPGTSGSTAGGSAGSSTAGSPSAGGGAGGGGAASGGSVATGGGGMAAGGGGGGTGGATAGSAGTGGAAAGAGGGGGGPACDPSTGKALAFKNDKIDLVTGDLGADLAGGNSARTIELWAHYLGDKSWASEHTVIEIGRKTNDANQVFGLDMSDRTDAMTGKFDPYTNGVGDNDPTPVMAAPEGWHHLAWSFDGAGHFQFVFDGNKVTLPHDGGGTAMLKTTQGIVTLGGSQSFGTSGWEGEMDEVRIWSVARTPADIKRDMKVKLKGTEAGLVAYYNLDEGTGTTADDISKKAGHKLSFCDANGGSCPAKNDQPPSWVASSIPGPFTCAP